MKVGFTLKKELKEPILKEIKDGNFSGANEFINHAIEEYFKNKNKGEDLPDIDEFFNLENEKSRPAYKDFKVRKNYEFINETKEKDLNVVPINPSTTYYYSQDGSSGSTGYSKDDFEFNIYSSDFSKLNTLEPNTNYSFQALHSPDSMLFGQIN